MQRKRSKWTETISGANAEHQIYLDESGINTNLTRHYAHAVHGKQLVPSLEKDDVVIMDNMRSHHAQIVTELLDKAGISYLYLPPYSPDLNPIEKMWSKMKSFLRKRKVRVAAELPEAVKAALETISTNDCKGWVPRI